ncbi:MAG: hypothetical protein P4M11_14380, partial [Candidatus Pacebacteria bacterium]|nr:hypothetical protein [Candidatus Paceibacterota bacterium]
MFRLGYQRTSRLLYISSSYLFTLLNFCFSPSSEFINCLIIFLRTRSPPTSLLVIAPTMKNHFIYERYTCLVVAMSVMISSGLAFFYVASYRIPVEGIVISQADIQHSLKFAAIILANCVLSEMYFDKVRDDVHDEVQKYSDQVQKATEDKEAFFATMSH